MSRKIIISIILVCIVAFTYLSIPAIATLGESLLVRFEICNPYVNNGFRGWSRAQVEDFNSFLIPSEWSLEEDSGIYKIINNSNEVWAFGAVLGADNSSFGDYGDLISAIYNTSPTEIEIDPFNQFLMMEGSDVDLLRIHEDVLVNELYCIQLFKNAKQELVWVLTPDLSSDAEQYDIAEAIVYSFAFNIGER